MTDHITRTVTVSLDEIIGYDINDFLDLLEVLFFNEEVDQEACYCLSDISYKAISVNEDGTLNIAVTGLAFVTNSDEDEGEE